MGSGSKKLTRHSEKNLAPLFQKKRATIRRLLVRVSVFTLSLVSFSYVPAIRRSSSGSTDTHSLHAYVSPFIVAIPSREKWEGLAWDVLPLYREEYIRGSV
nr:hypothetical protein [Porphyromonas gulae]